ncbi:isochorismate synthase [candidate division KSB1 bacterium]|nr:isochorismate synthase [candidate division KSB1 bacterium]
MASKFQSAFEIEDAARSLELFYRAGIFNRLPMAVWRCPNRLNKNLIVDLSGDADREALNLNVLKQGFVFSPFTSREEKSAFLIKANLHLNETSCIFDDFSNGHIDANITSNKLRFESTLKELNKTGFYQEHARNWYNRNSSNPSVPATKEQEFCNWVEVAIEQIRKGEFRKVVLSRTHEVLLKNDFSALGLFHKLCVEYPTAFVSLVAIPGNGTWVGATPELLLSLDNQELTTVALAGTQPVKSNRNIQASKWGKKEIVEQEIVSEYIRDCFKQQNINDFSEHGPETVQIGNILHLQTKFIWKISRHNEVNLVNRLLSSLHPTPAVCGVAKRAAMQFIEKTEPHEREFYAGILGPVNIKNQSRLFANLRCLQLQNRSAILYAGGGITIDSIPKQEWLETELKLNALLKFIEKPNGFPLSEMADSARSLEGTFG